MSLGSLLNGPVHFFKGYRLFRLGQHTLQSGYGKMLDHKPGALLIFHKNSTLLPAESPRRSRKALGKVICPLLVKVVCMLPSFGFIFLTMQ